ncbi:MAG: hypothetical protein MR051_04995 [Lentisphaeria bacterium]|nr:hypothetical protein [Lentisphaeria bacterium]
MPPAKRSSRTKTKVCWRKKFSKGNAVGLQAVVNSFAQEPTLLINTEKLYRIEVALFMKIEMGESLGVSWMKHVKECQFVQTNWKVSPCWKPRHDEQELDAFLNELKKHFGAKGLDIFKNNSNFTQIMRQAECDIIGCALAERFTHYYALEVAYHGNQLNYGSKLNTIAKVIAKLLRAAIVFYCYLDVKEAEIGFASPKIGPAILDRLMVEIADLQNLFYENNFRFQFKLYANQDFGTEIMNPVLKLSDSIADTGELFLRSVQLYDLIQHNESMDDNEVHARDEENTVLPKLAQLVKDELIPVLRREDFPQAEINDFLDLQFSKDVFGISYPLLARSREPSERYYATPVTLHGQKYYLCSQWFEKNRGALVSWIEQHQAERD